jgi:hypothetical protein
MPLTTERGREKDVYEAMKSSDGVLILPPGEAPLSARDSRIPGRFVCDTDHPLEEKVKLKVWDHITHGDQDLQQRYIDYCQQDYDTAQFICLFLPDLPPPNDRPWVHVYSNEGFQFGLLHRVSIYSSLEAYAYNEDNKPKKTIGLIGIA